MRTTLENQHPTQTIQTPSIERPGPDLIGWGAVFAGLVVVMGISWVWILLGSAIGVSVADANDIEAMGAGFGAGTIGWMIFTAVISYFFGGWLTAWLSGKTPKKVGMLHGVTVWGLGIILTMLLGYTGVVDFMRASQASLGTATISADGLANASVVAKMQIELKRHAIRSIAEAESAGGAEVSPTEVKQGMGELDAQALQTAAIQLLQGDTEAAKNILIANSSLSEAQADDVLNGVKQDTQQLQAEANQRREIISDYTQAVLWTAFVSSILGLVFATLGGLIGANGVRHFYATHPRVTVSNRAGP